MSLGDQLRSARERKGLTISDIARTTYIRAQYLEGIERDDFSSIPPSRLRYFIQDYAKSVDLDAARLLQELPDDLPAPLPAPVTPAANPATPDSAPARPFPLRAKAGMAKKTFGAQPEETAADEPVAEVPAAVAERPSRGFRRKRPRYTPLDQGNPALVRGLITVAVLLLIGLGIYFMTGGFDSDEDNGMVSAAGVEDSGGVGADTRILSRSENEADTAAAAEEVVGDSLTLQGHATAEVWYSIKMDNRQETGTLDSGEVKVWKAEREFRVSLGNAGGLEFSLNGRPLGVLGPKQTSLRNKVIDAQGIRESVGARPRQSSSAKGRTSRKGTEQTAPANRLRSLESTEPRRAVDPE